MLYLTRKIGESIIINNNIEMTVMDIRGKTVKIGFLFPKEATILRKELHQRILEENIAASNTDNSDLLEVEFNLGNSPEEEDDNRGNR
jgi:carbon storage regulator